MERFATTIRLDPVLKDGLSKLSKLLNKSVNQLANEAIRDYVAKRTLDVESDLESTLEELRAYRKRDPDFERVIAQFAKAEASADQDPAEGRVIEETGPAEKAVLKLLNE